MASNCIIWKLQNNNRETQIFLLEDHSLIELIRDRLTVKKPWEMCYYSQESIEIIYHVYINGTHNRPEGWGLNIPFVGGRKMEAVGSFKFLKRIWPIERGNNWWGNPEWAENILETGIGSNTENANSTGANVASRHPTPG